MTSEFFYSRESVVRHEKSPSPPLHINCRCTLVPYQSGELKVESGDNSTLNSKISTLPISGLIAPLQVILSDPVAFEIAGTIEDAQAVAKKLIVEANYQGMPLDTANAFNQELFRLYEGGFSLDFIKKIGVLGDEYGEKTLGRYFKETKEALIKPFTLDQYEGIMRAGFDGKEFSTNSPRHTIIHEIAHSILYTYQKMDDNKYDKSMNEIDRLSRTLREKDNYKVLSMYASQKASESFCEAFVQMVNGTMTETSFNILALFFGENDAAIAGKFGFR